MRTVERYTNGGTDLKELAIDVHVVFGVTRFAIMIDDDFVPVGVLLARGGYNGLNIVVMSVVLPNAANITRRPDGRPTADPAEGHFGEVVRPITGAEMDQVLNTALAIECGADTDTGREYYVCFPVVTGYDADILMSRAGRPGNSPEMQLAVVGRYSDVGIMARQPFRAMPYVRIKLWLLEVFDQIAPEMTRIASTVRGACAAVGIASRM